jgi:molybdate transport system regulatory protein
MLGQEACMGRVRVSVYLGRAGHKLGPGKIALLEAIDEHGSISAAARSMGMAYRHAWEMVDELNHCFDEPAVQVSAGGRTGGGAALSARGRQVVRRFRAIEAAASRASRSHVAALEAHLDPREPSRRHGRSGRR